MKKFILTLMGAMLLLPLSAQWKFDDFFLDKTLRFDFTRAGNADSSTVYFEQLKEEPFWGGSHTQLIDQLNFGDYRLMVYDSASSQLIYSRGYSTLFFEWQATPEAKTENRSYTENVVLPYPKQTVKLVIEERNRKTVFVPKYTRYISPNAPFIQRSLSYNFPVKQLYGNRPHATALDIVILPEGYTQAEMAKFEADAQRFIGYFFGAEPFASHKDEINFRAVMAPSPESGTDIPHKGIWRNTLLNTHYYTFYTDRYLTTRDMRTVRDLAALAPYDQIYILVNSTKYGGGGIYNYYNLCASDMEYGREVFTHEFGHAFAALADEYAYGDTPPQELYDLTVEPWQVNLTTLVDFKSKWADLVKKGTKLPTPNDQTNVVGAFEGGGYTKTKIYRPMFDCKMRSNALDKFCPVCYRTVLATLQSYTR